MRAAGADSGFSLVEILVVLAIVAAAAGLTLTAMGGADRRGAHFAARLAADIDLAADRAVVDRAPATIQLTETSYQITPGGAGAQTPDGLRLRSERNTWIIDPAGGAAGFEIAILRGERLVQVAFDGLDAHIVEAGAP